MYVVHVDKKPPYPRIPSTHKVSETSLTPFLLLTLDVRDATLSQAMKEALSHARRISEGSAERAASEDHRSAERALDRLVFLVSDAKESALKMDRRLLRLIVDIQEGYPGKFKEYLRPLLEPLSDRMETYADRLELYDVAEDEKYAALLLESEDLEDAISSGPSLSGKSDSPVWRKTIDTERDTETPPSRERISGVREKGRPDRDSAFMGQDWLLISREMKASRAVVYLRALSRLKKPVPLDRTLASIAHDIAIGGVDFQKQVRSFISKITTRMDAYDARLFLEALEDVEVASALLKRYRETSSKKRSDSKKPSRSVSELLATRPTERSQSTKVSSIPQRIQSFIKALRELRSGKRLRT